MNFISVDRSFKPLHSFDIAAAEEDIHVLAYLALFIQDAVAKRRVTLPNVIQGIAHCSKIARKRHFRLAAGERF